MAVIAALIGAWFVYSLGYASGKEAATEAARALYEEKEDEARDAATQDW